MRPHVLLVEPDPAVAEALSRDLSAAMPSQVVWLPSPQATLDFVEESPHLNLALVRWIGKNLSSAKIVAALRKLQPDLPILLLTDERTRLAPDTIDLLQAQGLITGPDQYAEVAPQLFRTARLDMSAHADPSQISIARRLYVALGGKLESTRPTRDKIADVEHITLTDRHMGQLRQTLAAMEGSPDTASLVLSRQRNVIGHTADLTPERAREMVDLASRSKPRLDTTTVREWLSFHETSPATWTEPFDVGLISVQVAGDLILSAGWRRAEPVAVMRNRANKAADALRASISKPASRRQRPGPPCAMVADSDKERGSHGGTGRRAR